MIDSARRARVTEKKKRLSIRDVARYAKVSIATGSRTINRVPSVDKRLAKRVFAAIEELNYSQTRRRAGWFLAEAGSLGFLISEMNSSGDSKTRLRQR
jgi:DNA-binding LacI/PurR family transcriptional regulator